MDTSAMTEADKDKIWDAIGKSCVVFEVSTLDTSEPQGQRCCTRGHREGCADLSVSGVIKKDDTKIYR